jgi:hypothetical protein
LFALTVGILLFLWLRIEDSAVFPAVFMGFGSTLTAGYLWLTTRFGGKSLPMRYLFPGAALLGALSGLAVSAVSAALMLLKNGMHGHAFPDYPFGVIVETLQRAPLWALAGALACLGLALAWRALRSES